MFEAAAPSNYIILYERVSLKDDLNGRKPPSQSLDSNRWLRLPPVLAAWSAPGARSHQITALPLEPHPALEAVQLILSRIQGSAEQRPNRDWRRATGAWRFIAAESSASRPLSSSWEWNHLRSSFTSTLPKIDRLVRASSQRQSSEISLYMKWRPESFLCASQYLTFRPIFEPWMVRDITIRGKTTRGFGTENMQKIPGPKSRHAQIWCQRTHLSIHRSIMRRNGRCMR